MPVASGWLDATQPPVHTTGDLLEINSSVEAIEEQRDHKFYKETKIPSFLL